MTASILPESLLELRPRETVIAASVSQSTTETAPRFAGCPMLVDREAYFVRNYPTGVGFRQRVLDFGSAGGCCAFVRPYLNRSCRR